MAESYVSGLRARIGSRKVLLSCTGALVLNDSGAILWGYSEDFKCWGLPGGYMELGESVVTGVQREVLEETGLVVEPMRLIGINSFDSCYPNGDKVWGLSVTLECAVVNGILKPDAAEVRELRFWDRGTIPSNVLPECARVATEFFNRNIPSFEAPVSSLMPNADERTVRALVGTSRMLTVGVGGIVRNAAGHILLTKRADSGLWGLPAGLSNPQFPASKSRTMLVHDGSAFSGTVPRSQNRSSLTSVRSGCNAPPSIRHSSAKVTA